jgi:NAD(P)-dependent dehydrogenase (short-subunit alcohol dehydrogenase family)
VPAALVTGAGRGLGLEIARSLAARGLTVHVTDVDESSAAAAAEQVGAPAFSSKLAVLAREGYTDIHISCVCPDGIWTPMIADKLDDPDAAPSFSGQLLRAEDVAPHVAGLLDRPRPVLAVPRWRGVQVRILDAFPGVATRLIPLFMADARRRQRRWKKLIEAGKAP